MIGEMKIWLLAMQTFDVRVFIGNDEADLSTKLTISNWYLGTLSAFGMGDAQMNMKRKCY